MESGKFQDWYAMLKLAPEAPDADVAAAVERLSRQASALAVTAPERSHRLRETIRLIKRDLLTDPQTRRRYDEARATALAGPTPLTQGPASGPAPSVAPPAGPAAAPTAPPGAGQPGPAARQTASPWSAPGSPAAAASPQPGPAPFAGPERLSSRLARFLRTGWTCRECGREALPSERFCAKCGAPILPPGAGTPPGTAAPAAPALPSRCQSCDARLGPADTFCTHCGAKRQGA